MNLISLTNVIVSELLPDIEFKVQEIESSGDKVIQILVPEESMSTIIGKNGKIANSIRTIVQASAYNNNMGRVRVNIDSL